RVEERVRVSEAGRGCLPARRLPAGPTCGGLGGSEPGKVIPVVNAEGIVGGAAQRIGEISDRYRGAAGPAPRQVVSGVVGGGGLERRPGPLAERTLAVAAR